MDGWDQYLVFLSDRNAGAADYSAIGLGGIRWERLAVDFDSRVRYRCLWSRFDDMSSWTLGSGALVAVQPCDAFGCCGARLALA